MGELTVTIENDGRRETYEHPQLDGLEISADGVELKFHPVHSDTLSITCGREDLISASVEV